MGLEHHDVDFAFSQVQGRGRSRQASANHHHISIDIAGERIVGGDDVSFRYPPTALDGYGTVFVFAAGRLGRQRSHIPSTAVRPSSTASDAMSMSSRVIEQLGTRVVNVLGTMPPARTPFRAILAYTAEFGHWLMLPRSALRQMKCSSTLSTHREAKATSSG